MTHHGLDPSTLVLLAALASSLFSPACGGVATVDDDGGTETGTSTGVDTSTGAQTSTGSQTSTGILGTQTDTSITTATSTDAQCGNLMFDDVACDGCVNAQCCEEKALCPPETKCHDIVMCIEFECEQTGSDCIETCKQSNKPGIQKYEALVDCMLTCEPCLAD